MIDALFGSKTRVKLLHLFLNNPGKSFYVREITRLIDEQINSVRRELSNMLQVGIITSATRDNKLYYEVNQRYAYYGPLRDIFRDGDMAEPVDFATQAWTKPLTKLKGIRVVLAAGSLVAHATSRVDLLLVGTVTQADLQRAIAGVESIVGREIAYSVLDFDEFYYRLSMRDRFITEITHGKHMVVIDSDNIMQSVA